MKTEERELIQSLLAPLTGLPAILSDDRQQLASLLAPLAALPSAVRALARTQDAGEPALPSLPGALAYAAREVARIAGVEYVDGEALVTTINRALAVHEHDAQNGAREAPATEQQVLDELAEAGGFELVGEDVRGREFEVIANYVRMGREYEVAGGKRGHDVELSEMYASGARDGRERAAQGALLALLDERCPGARHERVGLGKVEDLPSGELRAEIARRWYEARGEALEYERATDGDDRVEDARARGYGQAIDDLARDLGLQEHATQSGLRARLRAALDAEQNVEREVGDKLREALPAHAVSPLPPYEDMDVLFLVEKCVEAFEWHALVERDLRKALDNAGVAHQESDALQCVELLTLVASRNHNARERLDDANETIGAIDAELRRFLQACGEKLDGKERVLDLARRLADAGQRTVVEVPRSARDGARRELREIVSALGLRVEIDHLALPEARASVVRAVQALGGEAAPTHDETCRWTLAQLCKSLAIPFDFLAPPPSVEDALMHVARAIREHYVNARHEDLARGQQLVIDAVCAALSVSYIENETVEHWAGRLKEHVDFIAAGRPMSQAWDTIVTVGADTSSEQRASVLAAVQALGGELPPEPTLGEACRELDERIYALTYWAKDNLPLAAVWDIQLVETCPIAFEHLKCAGPEDKRLASADDDPNIWAALARDLRAVSEGDEVAALAPWLKVGQDARAVLEAVLDRVSHLEDKIAEFDDQDEERKTKYTGAVREYVEDLARALYENFPLGVAPQLVARCARDLDRVDDPLVNGVRSLLAGAAGRAHEPRTLEDWVALHPTERNRLIDRTRDALAAVAA